MKLTFNKVDEHAIVPTRGTSQSAGLDLYAHIAEGEITIAPGETEKIGTGIKCAIPEGYFGAIYARSGLATKKGLRPANCVGVADSDYRGEIIVALHNDSHGYRTIKHGDRIAQLIIQPYLEVEMVEVEDLGDTERGSGGFGSTGNK